MASFSAADLNLLLDQPGIMSYRDYGSSGAWTEFLGVNGAKYLLDHDDNEVSFDDVGTVKQSVSNERGTINISAGKVLDMDKHVDLTGALFTRVSIAGTPVAGATQDILSGNWAYDQFILIENQNGDGSEITVNSVTLSTDGALVEDTDFFVMKTSQGWGIYIIDSATVTTESQDIEIDYDYTPSASVDYKWGGIATITPIEIKFETETPDGKAVVITFYKVFPSGKFGHGFGSENSPEPVLTDLEFVAKKDTSRSEGDQVMKINIAAA